MLRFSVLIGNCGDRPVWIRFYWRQCLVFGQCFATLYDKNDEFNLNDPLTQSLEKKRFNLLNLLTRMNSLSSSLRGWRRFPATPVGWSVELNPLRIFLRGVFFFTHVQHQFQNVNFYIRNRNMVVTSVFILCVCVKTLGAVSFETPSFSPSRSSMSASSPPFTPSLDRLELMVVFLVLVALLWSAFSFSWTWERHFTISGFIWAADKSVRKQKRENIKIKQKVKLLN